LKNLWLFDQTKLNILATLWNCKTEYCGCDLLEILKIKKTLLHYHLKPMLEAKLIQEEKCGRNKIYTINSSEKVYIRKVLKIVNLI
jgi:DNA-binding transcriptional ArsR family regulator